MVEVEDVFFKMDENLNLMSYFQCFTNLKIRQPNLRFEKLAKIEIRIRDSDSGLSVLKIRIRDSRFAQVSDI